MSELILPPLLNAVQSEAPFESAIKNVQMRKTGAGDLLWSKDQRRVKFAIILEPDVSTEKAVEMLPLTLVALGDCLGVLVPPQVGVQFRPPLQATVNAGIVGSVKAAMAETDISSDIPDWLVVGIEVGLARQNGDAEPGLDPDITTLDEEGCEDLDRNKFIETFARHFLSWMAIWNDDGFAPVARSWKFKAEDESDPIVELMLEITARYPSTFESNTK